MFRAFDKAIAVDEESVDRGIGRIVECARAMNAKYYSEGTSVTDTVTELGSLAKKTGIRPLADVDVLFRMPPGTYSRFNDYTGNGQSALLQEVREVLRQRYPRTEIRGDGPVVVVSFSDQPAVEVVPGVLVADGSNILYAEAWVPVTRDGGEWERADYGAELGALDAADGPLGGQLRRLIRYMKAWRRHCDTELKSIVLELMAVDFAKTWSDERSSFTFDDWLVRDFLRYMVNNYTTTYRLPGTAKTIETGYGWYIEALEDAAEACRHDPDDVLYRHYWRKVLGDDFGK
ncbi:hypothetical protein [Mycobacterium sp. OAS707]|uniref:SMODS domain-containing nucleotidyltransferase n=1 Tax=Mycobacterium sp. OAS707 TaxID=2663822 RepID=UPI001CEF4793|nr:hypothetical protein [Mycobacterium sp. OAS707]